MGDYRDLLLRKSQLKSGGGFDPVWMPDFLFPFQVHLVEWSVRQGRGAIFADCGLGKTPMQLVWAENVVRKTNRGVLILTPLAVGAQTVREAEKFGIQAKQSRDGAHGSGIVVTNYEQLHRFDPANFAGVVCDESSILKSYTGSTRKLVTRFVSKLQYRLLCTATAAPNDYTELGTSSEALSELSHSEMLKRFFRMLDDKGQKSESSKQEEAEKIVRQDGQYYQKLAYRVAQTIGQWRLKHHAVVPFWRWVSSWARACRKPSDLGFPDDGFTLPSLSERHITIAPSTPPPGMLFNCPAFGLGAERDERRRTLAERCAAVAELVNHDRPAVVWCHMNIEGDLLAETIPDAEQIAGSTPDERKIELYNAFSSGELRVLVIKPKIGAWGLNWQHCNHVVTFASHSFEQHYQSIRRCWRFGQKSPVTVDVISTTSEARIVGNLNRKAKQAEIMWKRMLDEMSNATRVEASDRHITKTRIPTWLASNRSSPTGTRHTAETASR